MPQVVETMYIKTTYKGYIGALKMGGPISTPMKVTKAQAVSMMVSGIPVVQYNPTTKETRELTLSNVNKPMPTVKKTVRTIAPPQVPKYLSGSPKVDLVTAATVEEPEPEVEEDTTDNFVGFNMPIPPEAIEEEMSIPDDD